MTNVIQFPRSKAPDEEGNVPSSMDEIREQKTNLKHVWLNEMCEVMVSTLIQQMEAGGFNIMDDRFQKDFGFLIETVRSSLCRTVDVYHPFQQIADNVMEHHEDIEGVLVIRDSISVKFKNDETPDDADTTEASPEVV